jgi:translocation and assembly module TamB
VTKPVRIALFSCAGIVLLALVAGLAALLIAQSDWLREQIRAKIVEQAETATGGRVEIKNFQLDWRRLTANVDGFVIHGTEAPSQAPLLAADRVTVGLRIISLFSRDVRLERIEVVHPRTHIIVDADGGTNLPRPKVPSKTRTSDDILNLRIGLFEVKNGEVLAESPGAPPHILPWSGSGRNLTVRAAYDPSRDRYSGEISLAPLHLTLTGYGPLDVDVRAAAAMERNQVVVSKAKLKSGASEVNLSDLTVGSFAAPVAAANYDVSISAAEAMRVLHAKMPVTGVVNATGKARYAPSGDFDVTGNYRGAGLSFGSVRNIRLTGNLAATQSKMALTSVRVSVLGGEVTGGVELNNYEVFKARADVKGLAVHDLAALGTTRPVPYDGLVSGTVEAGGKLQDLSRNIVDGTAQLTVTPAASGPAVHGEITASYSGAAGKLEMGHSWLELPNTRADVTGTLGSSLVVKLETKDLDDLLPALNGHTLPFALKNGSALFTGTVTGAIENPRIAGHAALRNVIYEGRLIDSVAGDVAVTSAQASVPNAVVVSSGITAVANGSISLSDWAVTDASAITGNLVANNVDMQHALELGGYKDQPVSGTISASARVSGTIGQPTGTADVTFVKGTIYQQPYDSVTAHVQYVDAGLQTVSGIFASGPKRVTFDVRYPHAGLPFPVGTLQITASSNLMALNQIALVRQWQPDVQGSAQFHGSATVRISRDAKNAIHVGLENVNGDGSAADIGLGGRELGDAHFSAQTQGNTVTAIFDSNAANARIEGQAKITLTDEYPITGFVTFSNASLNELAALAMTPAQAKGMTFDGSAEGQIDFNGPLSAPDKVRAAATIGRLEVHPLPGTPLATTIPGFSLRSNGPLRASFENSVLRLDAARFQAPETDMSVSGTAALSGASPLNLRLQGSVNLVILRNFVPDLASSGTLEVNNANIRGNWSTPDFSGSAAIRDGEFHYSDFSNGLTNATGEIIFSGSRATIKSFNADTGGGKFSGTGFASLGVGGAVDFQFTATAKDVRLRYPQGVSSISDSNITIVHNPQRSSISGTVTVRRLIVNPKQDAQAMLADMSETVRTPANGDSVFANMNLDVVIQTAPDIALQSSVAESIQADASLRLRGTVASPALVGRINVSQGEVIFFGNKYTITQGTISFYNPTRIEPILKVDLETKARGVEVTMTVTGAPGKFNMTYRSDPPLELADIVALLATGRVPDDPSVALRGNGPSQSFEQLGASALIGQTLANPVAGRLQRFFGVSRLKIDPQLTGVSGNPGARLTVEQQITPDILFTYITDVSNTSQQLLRVEWSLNRNWSAIIVREENGYVGLDFAYKKRFK